MAYGEREPARKPFVELVQPARASMHHDKMHRHRYTASLLLTVAASLTQAAPTGGSLQQIKWNETAAGANPLLQYGTLEVPMDWTNPNGAHITLDITRLKTNSTSKIGSLFLNPGGPGGRAGPLCEEQAEGYSLFSPALVESFDLICPDPRGVGASSQISCDPDLWSQTPSYYVDDEASFEAILDFNKKLGADCLQRSGPLLGFVDTTNAAKDLEAIRVALGEDKFDYLGFSYGTQLGAAYAELFPDKIRTMTLDGDVDHSMNELDGFVMSNWAMEDELNRFFAWCNKNETCAFHSDDRDAADIWDEMIASANQSPIPAPGCSKAADTASAGTCRDQVTGYNIIFNLENHFQTPARWPQISTYINQTIHGNATYFSNPLGGPNDLDYPNLAIGCLDWGSNSTTFDEHVALQNLGEAMFPHSLGSSMWLQFSTTCIGWPFPVTNPQHFLNPAKMALAPPILLVNSDHDPATPLPWAHGLHRQIPSSVLLTRTGDGHTSYTTNDQVRAMMDDYMINMKLPAPNTVVQEPSMT
ncbi:hypothetical protein LTR99_010690 [Exophiala xenobiotica]|uniref:AB hydrolase-1 domain-containing protein n=1 Tax=Vermiconidia calcicola TaxID=1690605 RepID=A0AAV9Q4J6_9PEZI|nr:hypothetical protein LTR92_007237 [Exophiala xenobiotica]KAK5533900.1 hypothetical protein LTR25_006880 [Vermiconidia calcicola]KAK5546451.1 hypothetical protein LTR23_003556 [Chaetothyriales sp. CCFEE 6169]KAK5272206.1 hypothetical protein LTR96_001836 [Exophiala xenobiotica]KAK5291837.1 hypothetical protein LTR99_010690 [Exophiala xenobiotica]